jgi:hypothetical protein
MESMQYFWRRIEEDYNFVRLLAARCSLTASRGNTEVQSLKFKPPIRYQPWDEYSRDCRLRPFGPSISDGRHFIPSARAEKSIVGAVGFTVGPYE